MGILLLVAGAVLAWLSLGTSLVTGSSRRPARAPSRSPAGIVVWGFAIVVPAVFLIMGVARMAAVIEALTAMRPRKVTPQLASALGPDHIAATDSCCPAAAASTSSSLGPFGIVVLGAVPPPSFSRHVGSRWEVRDKRGRWIPIEEPVERASRDAERMRGWLATQDRDFLVRVYAAIVTEDERVERSATCAVVTPAELGELARGPAAAARPRRAGASASLSGSARGVALTGRFPRTAWW